jgi:hypothetical protein
MVTSSILSIEVERSDDKSHFLPSNAAQSQKWMTAAEILSSWQSCASRYAAEVLHLSRRVIAGQNIPSAIESCSKDWNVEPDQVSLVWEYAPHVFAVPIASSTISTFQIDSNACFY